nr:unnamed protein product [Callosobruchus analis]
MKTLYQLNLISNKKDEREESKSIINILESFDFLVLVTFFSSLFEIINPVSTALQLGRTPRHYFRTTSLCIIHFKFE